MGPIVSRSGPATDSKATSAKSVPATTTSGRTGARAANGTRRAAITPSSTSSAVRESPTIARCSGRTVPPTPWFWSGYCAASRPAMAATSCRALSTETPGLSHRPTDDDRADPEGGPWCADLDGGNPDIGGKATTTDLGKAIAEAL